MNLDFIVGTGRCGSSIIHEILVKHEDIGFISNIEDNLPWLNLKGRFNNQLYRTPLGRFTRKGRTRFAPSEAYRLIARQASSVYERSSRDLVAEDVTPWMAGRFQSFFQQRYKAQNKELFLHKYTGWSRIGFFSKIFPDSRFVHIVRDGRAVANSWLQMPWWDGYRGPENWLWGRLPEHYHLEWERSGQSYTVLAGIAWKLLLDSYESSIDNIPESQCLVLKYEDFVAEPRETLDRIIEFLGLRWTRSLEQHFNRQEIFSSRSNAYERDLTSTQLRDLEASLEDKLQAYEYI